MTAARVLLLAVATLAAAGSNKGSRIKHQQTYAAHYLMPAEAMVPETVAADVHPMRIRVWVEDAYSAATPRWQERFAEQLERINGVLAPHFGVALELAEVRAWNPNADALDGLLGELYDADPGADVDWVIGLAGPERLVTSSFERLGVARPLTKHFVIRGMSDVDEGRALEASLPDLDAGDLDRVYRARKAHKELVVFLHEWAHTLGALHSTNEQDWMAPQYDLEAGGFGEANRGLIELALEYRLVAEPDVRAQATALRAYLDTVEEGEWWTRERDQLARQLDYLMQ